jgi:TRAP-type C4-dicarboxylate transport system substrate-binding protein
MAINRASSIVAIATVAAIAAGAWLAGVPGQAGTAEAKELRVAHFMSPKHPMHRFLMAPMAERLNEVSGGKLTMKIYPAGALGKGPREQYNRAVDGIADVTFGLAGYTSPQFPRTLLAELPDYAPTPLGATEKMWAALDKHISPDFKDVKLLAMWVNDAASIMTREKPVRTLADLKGMKIRAPSKLAAGLLRAWGAVPQTMPVTKVYTSMQTGVIDGVYIGASGIRPFKLTEVAKYFTVGLPPSYAAFYLIMNKGAWNGLSADEKAMLDKVSGLKASLEAAEAYADDGAAGVKLVEKVGRELIRLSPEQTKEFRAAAKPYIRQVLAEREKMGIAAGEIYGSVPTN